MEEERKQHRQQSLDVEDDIPLIDSDYNSGSSEPSPVPTRGSTNIIKRCSSSISRHITLPIKVSFKRYKVRFPLAPDHDQHYVGAVRKLHSVKVQRTVQ